MADLEGPGFEDVQPIDPARSLTRARWIARASGVFGSLTAVTVLAGWWFDIPALRSVLPGQPPMVALTAIGTLLLGAALWLATGTAQIKGARSGSRWLASAALLVGLGGLLLGGLLLRGLGLGRSAGGGAPGAASGPVRQRVPRGGCTGMSVDILFFTAINILMAWSVYIALSAGVLTFGAGAFMAVGCYATGLLTVQVLAVEDLPDLGGLLGGVAADELVELRPLGGRTEGRELVGELAVGDPHRPAVRQDGANVAKLGRERHGRLLNGS